MSHPQKPCHTLNSNVKPSIVLQHPRKCSHPCQYCDALKSDATPSKVLPHTQKMLPRSQKRGGTLKSAVTSSNVLPRPQKCCDILKSAATSSKVLPHPQKCFHTLKSHSAVSHTHSKVLPHHQKRCHKIKRAVTPSKVMPRVPLAMRDPFISAVAFSKVMRHPQKVMSIKPSKASPQPQKCGHNLISAVTYTGPQKIKRCDVCVWCVCENIKSFS